jgi:hypothetical protein
MVEPADAEILDEVRHRSGPIEDHLAALAASTELPDLALALCTLRIDEFGPALRAVLERAADGEVLDEAESRVLFCGLHILGGARESRSCAALLRFLRRPVDEIDPHLGDSITETLARIVAGVFDGDAETLFATIADASVDGYVRDALFGAAAFLTWDGRIARNSMHGFLASFHRERLAGVGDQAWYGWQDAIALLGLRDLAPLVREAWEERLIPEELIEPEYFEADLAKAEREPDDIGRFRRAHLGYIDDVVEAMSWCVWRGDADAQEAASDEYGDEWVREPEWAEPSINPLRHVGRNDPCPCGSGKKFKKCCLAADAV